MHFYFPLPPPHFSPTLFWVLSHHLNSSSSFLPASPGGHSCLPYNTQDRFPALLRQLRTHAHTHTHPRIHYHHQMLQHALGLRWAFIGWPTTSAPLPETRTIPAPVNSHAQSYHTDMFRACVWDLLGHVCDMCACWKPNAWKRKWSLS